MACQTFPEMVWKVTVLKNQICRKKKKMFETDLCHKTAQENFTKRESQWRGEKSMSSATLETCGVAEKASFLKQPEI